MVSTRRNCYDEPVVSVTHNVRRATAKSTKKTIEVVDTSSSGSVSTVPKTTRGSSKRRVVVVPAAAAEVPLLRPRRVQTRRTTTPSSVAPLVAEVPAVSQSQVVRRSSPRLRARRGDDRTSIHNINNSKNHDNDDDEVIVVPPAPKSDPVVVGLEDGVADERRCSVLQRARRVLVTLFIVVAVVAFCSIDFAATLGHSPDVSMEQQLIGPAPFVTTALQTHPPHVALILSGLSPNDAKAKANFVANALCNCDVAFPMHPGNGVVECAPVCPRVASYLTLVAWYGAEMTMTIDDLADPAVKKSFSLTEEQRDMISANARQAMDHADASVSQACLDAVHDTKVKRANRAWSYPFEFLGALLPSEDEPTVAAQQQQPKNECLPETQLNAYRNYVVESFGFESVANILFCDDNWTWRRFD